MSRSDQSSNRILLTILLTMVLRYSWLKFRGPMHHEFDRRPCVTCFSALYALQLASDRSSCSSINLSPSRAEATEADHGSSPFCPMSAIRTRDTHCTGFHPSSIVSKISLTNSDHGPRQLGDNLSSFLLGPRRPSQTYDTIR
jgi:hypothetical protein